MGKDNIVYFLKVGVWLTLFFCMTVAPVHAEQRIIEADGSYQVGDGLEENHATAKERARTSALRHASEEAALYLESSSAEEMGRLTKDEIRTLSAAVLQVKETRFQPEVIGDTIVYRCHVVVVVDTDNVMKEVMKDKQALVQNMEKTKEMEQLLEEKDRKIEELKRQYAEAKTEQERKSIRAEVKENDHLYPFTVTLKEAAQTRILGNHSAASELCSQIIYGLQDNGSAEAEKILEKAYLFRGTIDLESIAVALGKGELMKLSDSSKLSRILSDMEMAERILQKLHQTPKTALRDGKQHDYTDYISIQYYKLGVYIYMENYPMAMKLIDTLEKDVPNDYRIDCARAELNISMGKEDEALKIANAIISKEPRLPDGYSLRGRAYMGKHQNDLALEDFNKVIGMQPEDITSRFRRVTVCFTMLFEGLERESKKQKVIAHKVLPYIEEDEPYCPGNYIVMVGKGFALAFLGRYQEALQTIDNFTIMESTPDDVRKFILACRSLVEKMKSSH